MNGQVKTNKVSQTDASQAHLKERELALRWGMSQRTLQRWRAAGFGPTYIRIGGTIRYRVADILAYEHHHMHDRSGQ